VTGLYVLPSGYRGRPSSGISSQDAA
jgi:hypothetical protein